MSVVDRITQLKSELQRVNDAINAAQTTVTDLQARKQQIKADLLELQAFLDWKAAQP